MKKKIVAVICMIPLLLGGCNNSFPNLTDEQATAIGEYAAVTLLKYDANSRSRLVDLSQIDEEPVVESAPETEKQPEVMNPKPEPAEIAETKPAVEQGQSGMDAGVEMTAKSLEEFLELPEGVTLSYKGYDLCQSYQEADNSYFTLEASEGKKLLVTKFLLENASSDMQEIDILNRRDSYRLTVNDSYTRTALTTLLADDLSTYIGELEPGTSKEVVLLIEVDTENVESISLSLKNELKTYTIQLL